LRGRHSLLLFRGGAARCLALHVGPLGSSAGCFALAACLIEVYLRILNQRGLVEKEIRVDPCWVFNDGLGIDDLVGTEF